MGRLSIFFLALLGAFIIGVKCNDKPGQKAYDGPYRDTLVTKMIAGKRKPRLTLDSTRSSGDTSKIKKVKRPREREPTPPPPEPPTHGTLVTRNFGRPYDELVLEVPKPTRNAQVSQNRLNNIEGPSGSNNQRSAGISAGISTGISAGISTGIYTRNPVFHRGFALDTFGHRIQSSGSTQDQPMSSAALMPFSGTQGARREGPNLELSLGIQGHERGNSPSSDSGSEEVNTDLTLGTKRYKYS